MTDAEKIAEAVKKAAEERDRRLREEIEKTNRAIEEIRKGGGK